MYVIKIKIGTGIGAARSRTMAHEDVSRFRGSDFKSTWSVGSMEALSGLS